MFERRHLDILVGVNEVGRRSPPLVQPHHPGRPEPPAHPRRGFPSSVAMSGTWPSAARRPQRLDDLQRLATERSAINPTRPAVWSAVDGDEYLREAGQGNAGLHSCRDVLDAGVDEVLLAPDGQQTPTARTAARSGPGRPGCRSGSGPCCRPQRSRGHGPRCPASGPVPSGRKMLRSGRRRRRPTRPRHGREIECVNCPQYAVVTAAFDALPAPLESADGRETMRRLWRLGQSSRLPSGGARPRKAG